MTARRAHLVRALGVAIVLLLLAPFAQAQRRATQWPSRGDYFQAILTKGALNPILRAARIERKQGTNVALVRSGALGSVYRLFFPRTGGGERAVGLRFFHPPAGVRDRADPAIWRARYRKLTEYLKSVDAPPEIIEVRWLDDAIRVRGQSYPALLMPWADARSLDSWVGTRLSQGKTDDIRNMANNWRAAMKDLKRLQIAHGDLHIGNVLVERGTGTMRLIDYDAMYVPTLAGGSSDEIGSIHFQHPSYFHPAPRSRPYNANLDHFSALVIHLSLLAIAEDPTRWQRYHRDGENLIFLHTDFRNPGASPLFNELQGSADPTVKSLARALARYSTGSPEAVPDLEGVLASRPTGNWYRTGGNAAAPAPQPAAPAQPNNVAAPNGRAWYQNP